MEHCVDSRETKNDGPLDLKSTENSNTVQDIPVNNRKDNSPEELQPAEKLESNAVLLNLEPRDISSNIADTNILKECSDSNNIERDKVEEANMQDSSDLKKEDSNVRANDSPLNDTSGKEKESLVTNYSKPETSLSDPPDLNQSSDINLADVQRKSEIGELAHSPESAFQSPTSLGSVASEEPAVESKESLFKKLASRGAISITTANDSLLPCVTRPVESVQVASPQPKYKPGPKSVMAKRQSAKKIKIDPGKSMDIEKDFNNLITFLSSGSDGENASAKQSDPDKDPQDQSSMGDPVLKVTSSDSVENDYNLQQDNSYADKNAGLGLKSSQNNDFGCSMDVDENHEQSIQENSGSHDDSKLDTSDFVEEVDILPSTTPKFKRVIEEGSAEILLSATKNVFYNKVQEFNRDMSIAALTVFSQMHQQDPRTRNRGKKRKEPECVNESSVESTLENVFEAGKKSDNGITILEALSATGLRSIRYAREIPGVKEVVANDLSHDAVDSINKNIVHNRVQDMVTTSMSDASLLMYQRQSRQEWFDAIDLDPYGCPSRFLDSAVQAVRDGGMLLVTCTDMAVLAGNSPETCYVKYGAVSLRSSACHEMALRIVLQSIEAHANRYGRYIVPLLSFSADFYIRLIVQVYTSPVTCKKTTSKLSMVYQCVGCHTYTLQPLGLMSQEGPNSQSKFSLPGGPCVNTNCYHCNHKHYMGGPIWSAPMYSAKFLEGMLRVAESGKFGTSKRMQGMLEVIREELPDVPLYYTIAGLCTKLHCQAIPLIDIRSAILNTGYRVSSSHAAPTAVKTNAPANIIWDIMRCWVHMNPVSQKRLVPGSVPAAIILEPPQMIANFDIHPKARPSSSMRKLLRYQPNPEKNWGPGMRAKCNVPEESLDDKRKTNQNKNKKKKNITLIEVVTIEDEDEVVEESNPPTTSETDIEMSESATCIQDNTNKTDG